MSTKRKAPTSNWAAQFSRPETAGRGDPAADDAGTESAAPQPVVAVAPRLARGPHKRPVTYRLVDADLDLIDAAVAAAAARGERLTKEEAVAQAIRQTYGHLTG